jgi:putative ABC transport system permease protein
VVRLPISALDRKLLRDMVRMWGQALAIAMIALCGTASFVALQGSYDSLWAARAAYYEQYRFADIFAPLKRAPESLLARLRDLPGVRQIQGRVVFDASLDVPGLAEPASARIVSLPRGGMGLNGVYLRQGRLPEGANDVLVSEAFATANRLRPGQVLSAVINGRHEPLHITGVAISPEYISEMKSSGFPDNRRFGVFWMDHAALAATMGMRDGFNDLSLRMTPYASEQRLIEQIDAILAPYGALGAYGRADQLSHRFLDNELEQNRVSATVLPVIFMVVVAFLVHNVLLRLTSLQRAQIGLLKSFGYGKLQVGLHYLKFALLTVGGGGAAGVAVGAWLGAALATVYARFYHFPQLEFRLSKTTVLLALTITLVSAGLGSVLAVWRVLRLPPAVAMRPASPAHFRAGLLERMGLRRFMSLPVRMVVRNLERNPIKAGLSVLGLTMAGSLMVTGQFAFDSLDEMIRVQFRMAQRDDVSVDFNEVRSPAALHALASMPGVLRVEGYRNLPVRLRAGAAWKKTVITGLAPGGELRRLLDEREQAIALPPQGLVLSKKMSELLGVRVGNLVQVEVMQGRQQRLSVQVGMVIDEPVGLICYMDRDALASLMTESDGVTGAWMAVDPAQKVRLYRELKQVPAIASVTLREAMLQSFTDTVAENLKINTTAMLVFACVITFGVVYNAARVSLSERALELASLRVLGFTRNEAGRMLLMEQALLVLFSLPLACLLGYGLSALLAALLSQELFRIPLAVSTRTLVSTVLTVVLASAASGWIVWRMARRLDLIEVLKTRET